MIMKVLLCLIMLELTFRLVQQCRLGLEGCQFPLGGPFAWRLFLGLGIRQLSRGSCLMTWHMPFGLGNFLVSNISEPFYDPLGYYEASPLYFFSVRLQTFGFSLPMMGSHFCMTVCLWTANYLGLTPGFLIMELVALWVSFSSPGCQLPWVGFYPIIWRLIYVWIFLGIQPFGLALAPWAWKLSYIPNTFEPFLAHSGHFEERNGTENWILQSII